MNQIFSGYQPHQVAEWQANQRFEDHVCPRQFHDDKDGPQNVGLLAIQPPKTAASP